MTILQDDVDMLERSRLGGPAARPVSQLTRRRALALGAAVGACGGLISGPARAVLRFDLNQGNIQPLPIAVTDFLPGTPANAELARTITQIITANLKRSGLFAPIDPAAFIEKIVN